MQNTRKIIQIDEELCDGCGQCVPDCAEGSLQIIDGKAKLVSDNLCDGLGACLGACPQGALKIIERKADDFDEEAVEEFLRNQKKSSAGSRCPSSQIQTFQPQPDLGMAGKLKPMDSNSDSALTHWPIQIRLVPAEAPFLKGADLLIAADCSAIAATNFQGDYLQGKKVLMGCPKFDDQELYISKFTDIINKSGLNSITVLIMEVPCCSSMLTLLKEAVKKASKAIDIEEIIISRQGQEISRKKW
ncbi:MAG: 4Fe-4S ferredoxin [Desulfotalea sp.]